MELSFSEPNQVEMSQFTYTTGASNVTLEGLANANFKTLLTAAPAITLDFSGDWQRDATVSIDCGFSDLTLVIPEGLNTILTIDSALADINIGPGWSQKNKVYTQEGEGPTLTIVVNMCAGNAIVRD